MISSLYYEVVRLPKGGYWEVLAYRLSMERLSGSFHSSTAVKDTTYIKTARYNKLEDL